MARPITARRVPRLEPHYAATGSYTPTLHFEFDAVGAEGTFSFGTFDFTNQVNVNPTTGSGFTIMGLNVAPPRATAYR